MKIDLEQSEFLIWREPRQPHFTLFYLSESAATNDQFVACPFQGKLISRGIVGQQMIATNELPHVLFPVPEQNLPAIGVSHSEHLGHVAEAVKAIKKGVLRKVVLSRAVTKEITEHTSVWFAALADAYPFSCTFAFYTKESGFWMGATPESQLKLENGMVKAASLAGTRAYNTMGFWGKKEQEEQAIVTSGIEQVFKTFGVTHVRSTAPVTKVAGPVEHIFTEICGEFPANKNIVDLALALHPTPAVGGLPKKDAIAYILKNEGYNRSFYSGFFGVITAEHTHFWVNLRCMQLFKNGLVLYAGGGITADSDPQAEWDETCRKLQTLEAILKDE